MVRWPAMAEIKPFSALRYDTGQAGPLEDLVAPPYDVIGPAEREQYLARSPYNVVHLTLPDSEEEAGRDLRAWRENGVLTTEEPAFWALSQDYVGPDGVARTRTGVVVVAQDRAVRERNRPAARADASRPEGGPAAPPARDADAARADLPPVRGAGPVRGPRPAAGARGRRRTALASRGRRHRRRVRRPAAPDRRRPPSLRDRARLPRGGRNPGQRVHDGRARQPRGSRPHDLPDPPGLPRAAGGPARGRASATIQSPRSRSSAGSNVAGPLSSSTTGARSWPSTGPASSTCSSSTGSARRA